jgi:hypothetical protein
MKKKILLLAVVIGVTCLLSSPILANDFIGLPAGSLPQGQTSIGLGGIFSQMDLDFDAKAKVGSSKYPYKGQVDGAKLQRTFVDVSHGLTDNLEIFGRVGGSRFMIHEGPIFEGDAIFDGDMGPTLGGGIRGTLYEHSNPRFGGVALVNWARTEDQRQRITGLTGMLDTEATIEFWEFIFAVGFVHTLAENVQVYGGPFFYWLDGTVDGKVTWSAYKLEDSINESGNFGGYLGGLFDVTENCSIAAEYQLADGSSGFGVNAIWKLK